MSKSIHITIKDFRGLKKEEIDKQVCEPSSDLNKWSEKSKIEKEIKLERKRKKKENKKRFTTQCIIYCWLIFLAENPCLPQASSDTSNVGCFFTILV